MSFSSPGSGLRVAGLIVGGVGLVLGLAGAIVWRYVPGMVAAEHARLDALPSPDAHSLGDTPAGREVIVEGRIAPSQPVRFRDFVAYVKEEEQRDAKERERTGNWKTVETVTPPLDLVAGDGIVRVVDDNYAIRFAKTRWHDTSKVIDTAYSGLVAGEAVFVHGHAAAGGLEADIVGSGTRASYLATVAGNIGVMWWLGVGFMIVGGGLVLVAIVLFVTAARTRAAASR
jgi:hypothetical protein